MQTETEPLRNVPLPPLIEEPVDNENFDVDLCPSCHFYYKRSGVTRGSAEKGEELNVGYVEHCLVAPDKISDISDLYVFECSRYDKDETAHRGTPVELNEEEEGEGDGELQTEN